MVVMPTYLSRRWTGIPLHHPRHRQLEAPPPRLPCAASGLARPSWIRLQAKGPAYYCFCFSAAALPGFVNSHSDRGLSTPLSTVCVWQGQRQHGQLTMILAGHYLLAVPVRGHAMAQKPGWCMRSCRPAGCVGPVICKDQPELRLLPSLTSRQLNNLNLHTMQAINGVQRIRAFGASSLRCPVVVLRPCQLQAL